MDNHGQRIRIFCGLVAVLWAMAGFFSMLPAEPNTPTVENDDSEKIVAILTCHDMIDDGLAKSIQRRAEEAIGQGADYLFLDVQTYGGLVKSADDIGKYLILELADRIHTVAYVSTEAISAGSMISVSCKDIIMRNNTTIGCSAPILGTGSEMGETEREKSESFVRSTFSRAAGANGYPEALLKAMVSRDLEVWQVKNTETGQMEYFETEFLPNDPNTYAMDDKKLVVKEGELLTLTAQEAKEYGIARAVVNDIDEALAFLAERDGVTFSSNIIRLDTTWSEELVRFLQSPTVMGILFLGILLGVYVEFNTPGLGFPSLLAATCLVILVSPRYLSGMANWIEVAILCIGFVLIMIEIFVIPGFGVAGFAGIICILAGFFGMLVKNPPGQVPWPKGAEAWTIFTDGLFGMSVGFFAFVVLAILLAKYMDRLPILRSFVLKSSLAQARIETSKTCEPQQVESALKTGQVGTVVSPLRPAGKVQFEDNCIVDVVSDGEFLEKGKSVKIIDIHGNMVTVTECKQT
ncbi:MAG: NfeD family protein [Planctomycetota bacterium]|jgi:membrane-bound serine protease (ClpP class)